MSGIFVGSIRRIDFEPKNYGDIILFAHVFLEDKPNGSDKLDVYTNNPRLEAALLSIYQPVGPVPPKVEVHYEYSDTFDHNMITRVILDRKFAEKT